MNSEIDWIRDWISDSRCVAAHRPEANDRWLARSALHKALRRGRLDEALLRAAQLHAFNPTYLWRSLATIAAEDVGFGHPAAVRAAHLAQRREVARAVEPHRLIGLLVSELCQAPKTRAAAELFAIAPIERREDLKSTANSATSLQLLEMAQSTDPVEVAKAMLVARGWVQGRSADQRVTAEIADLLCGRWPGATGLAARQAFLHPAADVSITFGASLLLQEGARPVAARDRWPPTEMIGGYHAEALDLYSRTGRLALGVFAKQLAAAHPIVGAIDAATRTEAVGEAVFFEEGGLICPRLAGTELDELRARKDAAVLTSLDVPSASHRRLREIVRAELPRLNDLRRWSLRQRGR